MNPSEVEQAMAANKAIELYEQISAMCGEKRACPSPFDDIYHVLMKHVFTLERLRQV